MDNVTSHRGSDWRKCIYFADDEFLVLMRYVASYITSIYQTSYQAFCFVHVHVRNLKKTR